MEELTHNAKIAVFRILNDVVNADNIVKDVEVEYTNEIARSFEIADNYMDEFNFIDTLQALAIIRELSADLKDKIAQAKGRMIVVDGDINYNEIKLYNTVC